MKYAGLAVLIGLLVVPSLAAEETPPYPEPPQPSLTVGGGIWGRYLRLNLARWTDADGERMDREDLFYYGGRMVVSGPLTEPGDLRWRLGAGVGAAGREDDDVGELNLALATVALNSGLSWRPGRVGVSLDLSLGGAAVNTEIKREELRGGWDLYERRTTGLFFWEPLLSLDFQVLDIFVIRLQGGYSFLYGQGKEVGGPTAGIALDFGQWM